MIDIRHGIAGGLAGIAVDICFYPLQTIKTRIMASSNAQNLKNIALSKFKGFSCQMIVSFPYSFTFFLIYETVQAKLDNYRGKYVFASICAEICANLVRNPFEVIKQQLMVGRQKSMRLSIKDIFSNRGIAGFYAGYRATLMRDIIFSAIQLPTYELLFLKFVRQQKMHSILGSSIAGSIAAAIAGFLSCPLDVLKTREMTQNMKGIKSTNKIKNIYQQQGLKGFFKGVQFRCGILSFGGIVYFGALAEARKRLGICKQ